MVRSAAFRLPAELFSLLPGATSACGAFRSLALLNFMKSCDRKAGMVQQYVKRWPVFFVGEKKLANSCEILFGKLIASNVRLKRCECFWT